MPDTPTPEREPLDLDAWAKRYYAATAEDVETVAEVLADLAGTRVFKPLMDDSANQEIRDSYRADARKVLALHGRERALREENERLREATSEPFDLDAALGFMAERDTARAVAEDNKRNVAELTQAYEQVEAERKRLADDIKRREVRWARTVAENGKLAAEVERLRADRTEMHERIAAAIEADRPEPSLDGWIWGRCAGLARQYASADTPPAAEVEA